MINDIDNNTSLFNRAVFWGLLMIEMDACPQVGYKGTHGTNDLLIYTLLWGFPSMGEPTMDGL